MLVPVGSPQDPDSAAYYITEIEGEYEYPGAE